MDPLLMAPAETKTGSTRDTVSLHVCETTDPVFTCYVEQSLQAGGALSVDGVDRNRVRKPAKTETKQ